ncbi:MAG: hypothetical protein QM708_08235 [Propioniciclava sp.]|uniref:hypothetical protein n=1 Tax=Propioniciclava sp. TaxID=2038686 RepID=UPI0039E584E5
MVDFYVQIHPPWRLPLSQDTPFDLDIEIDQASRAGSELDPTDLGADEFVAGRVEENALLNPGATRRTSVGLMFLTLGRD